MNTPINFQKTVTAAGTAEAIISENQFGILTIKALAGNGGNIYVGDSTVDAATGYVLAAEEAVSLILDGLNKVYIDSDVNGEGVCGFGTLVTN